jgi:DNA-binding transcriptional ArsR family regulator
MDEKKQIELRTRATVFKALAHPSRLFILEQLADGERCVCELTDMIGVDTSTVSKHLSVLKNAGVIQDDKRGLQVYYSLKMPCILRFFECVGEVMGTNAKEQWEIANLNINPPARIRRRGN